MKRIVVALCLLALLLSACAVGGAPADPAAAPASTAAKPAPSAEPPASAQTAAAPTDPVQDWDALAGKGQVGTVLPDFSVQTAAGETFTLSEALTAHELVLINLWATWCPPCRAEFPYLDEAYEASKDRVAVIALSIEETDTLEALGSFAGEYDLHFPVARDEDYRLTQTFRVDAIPTSLLVDRSRTVVWKETGAMTSTQDFLELFSQYLSDSAEQPAGASYRVTLRDQDGAPVPGVVVNFCTDEACTQVTSDEKGVAAFAGALSEYHVQLLALPQGYSYTEAAELAVGTGRETLDLTVTRMD